MDAELLQQMNGLHRHHDARAIVDRAGRQVPRIQMAGDDHHLFRMLRALPVCNHVRRLHRRQRLGRQGQVHLHLALRCQILQQIGVFGSHGGRGNLLQSGRVVRHAGMRQPVVCTAHRTHQRGNRAQRSRNTRGSTAIDHRFTVCLIAPALGCQIFVEVLVEEQDLSFYRIFRETLQIGEGIDNNDRRIDAFLWCRYAAAQCSQHDLLRGLWRHARPVRKLSRFFAAHPVRHSGLLDGHRSAQRAHLARHPLHCMLRLRGPGEPRTDVVGQVAQFCQRIRIVQCRVAQPLHVVDLRRRPRARRLVEHLCNAGLRRLRGRRLGNSGKCTRKRE